MRGEGNVLKFSFIHSCLLDLKRRVLETMMTDDDEADVDDDDDDQHQEKRGDEG